MQTVKAIALTTHTLELCRDWNPLAHWKASAEMSSWTPQQSLLCCGLSSRWLWQHESPDHITAGFKMTALLPLAFKSLDHK